VTSGVGARNVEELVCYQLAVQLRRLCLAITARPVFKDDRRFRDDFRAAARSAPSNISEGFRRRSHREFARYLDIALSSIAEVKNHVADALENRYISPEESADCLRVARRANVAASRLRGYLLNGPDERRT
jgi:four helix bundle protein